MPSGGCLSIFSENGRINKTKKKKKGEGVAALKAARDGARRDLIFVYLVSIFPFSKCAKVFGVAIVEPYFVL
jgi:hypothetical protein